MVRAALRLLLLLVGACSQAACPVEPAALTFPCSSDEDCAASAGFRCLDGACSSSGGPPGTPVHDGGREGEGEDSGPRDAGDVSPEVDGGPSLDAGDDVPAPDANGGNDDGGPSLEAGVDDAGQPDGGLDDDGGVPDGGDGGDAGGDAGPPCVDEDGDGYGESCLLGADCDDADPARAFGLLESCDGIDNDCDEVADDGDVCPCPVLTSTAGGALHPYLLCEDRNGWHTAKERCESLGYRLVVVDDDAENAFIAEAAAAASLQPLWLGLSDVEAEGTFAWIDGTPLSFVAWWPLEPNQYGGGEEDCGEFNGGGWNDNACVGRRPYLCEVDLDERDPSAPCVDLDGDGRGQSCALGPDCDDDDDTRYRWHAAYLDRDGDGATEGHSDWTCGDDALPNGWLGAPSAQDDCDDGDDAVQTGCVCTVRTFEGSTYRLCPTALNWSTSRSQCGSLSSGADLAVITSLEEDEFLARHLYRINAVAAMWIGLEDDGASQTWIDGTPVSGFTAWGPGEPVLDDGNCHRLTQNGWRDGPCNATRGFICEE